MTLEPFLQTARKAADEAAKLISEFYRGDFDVEIKADRTPVTEADRGAEVLIRDLILDRYPDHAFYGEETGRRGDSEFLWLVDPIDGTKSFVRGYPLFSTQIALMRGEELVLGVSSAPWFGETAWAAKGLGAFLNGEACRVSTIDQLGDATLSTGNLASLAGDGARWSRFGGLVREINRSRGYGDFYHYHLLASGRIELVLESDVNILDIAALSVIVNEAGGRFTQIDGGPVGLDTRDVLASNGLLHELASEYV